MADDVKTTKKERTAPRTRTARTTAPHKLKLLFLVVNRAKAEYYSDLLEAFDVNMQMLFSAQGTASTEMRQILGLSDSEKVAIAAVIGEERAGEALSVLEEKFESIRGGKGIAYTVPISSTIGVAVYQFLCNHRK